MPPTIVHLHNRSGRSGAGGLVYPARFLAMGVLHQCARRARSAVTDGLESPRELRSRSTPSIRLTRSSSPMLPLSLFRSRSFSGANLLTLFLYSALSGMLFFFPLDLIQVQGYTPTQAGAALLPFILLMFLLSRWSGGLLDRYKRKSSLGDRPFDRRDRFCVIHAARHRRVLLDHVFPALVVLGLGMTISVAPLTTTVMNSVDQNDAGTASGINNAVSRVAAWLAVAAFGALLADAFQSALDRNLNHLGVSPAATAQVEAQRSRLAAAETDDALARHAIDEAFVAGYRIVLWFASGLAVASSLTAAMLIKTTSRSPRKTQ
jgi:hypothetical protein